MQSFFPFPAGRRPVFIPMDNGLVDAQLFKGTRPFFHMLSEHGIAAQFLQAVSSDIEQAQLFVSKHSRMDVHALQDVLSHEDGRPLAFMRTAPSAQKGRTRAVTLGNTHCTLHLYMIEEPNRYGRWKICGVEKE